MTDAPALTAPRALGRVLFVALFAAALLFSRGYRLNTKPLHHDESLFGYYSWYFSTYGVYEYDPILHGPFLILVTGAIFRLLGDNNLTLRTVPFVSGLLIFLFVLPLRRWFGRRGTLLALLLLLLSPDLCYYSRFIRNDVLFLTLTMLNLVSIAYALTARNAWPLIFWPVSLALLISVKENVVFLMASQVGFALLWIALDDPRIAAREREESEGRPEAKPGDSVVAALLYLNVSLLLWCAVAVTYAFVLRARIPLGHLATPLWLIGVVSTAALLKCITRAFRRNPGRIGLLFRLYERVYCDRYWCLAGLTLAVAVLCFCYSIALTQPKPVLTLLKRAVAYWWGEHASQRLGNRFHVYAPQIALYELPALAILAVALLRDWLRNPRRRIWECGLWLLAGLAVWASTFLHLNAPPAAPPAGIAETAPPTLYQTLTEQLLEHWPYLHLRSLGELFWAATIGYFGIIWTVRSLRQGRLVRAWLCFWLSTSYLFYGYAGEKVPWLALHVMLPLWLAAAFLWNEWSESCASRFRRGLAAVALGALLIWNGWQTCQISLVHPTDPAEIAIYNHTCPQTQEVAARVMKWMTSGEVPPAQVVVQGEASWPLIWYFRNFREVRFEPAAYQPLLSDQVVITDPGVEDQAPILRQDFRSEPFDLRSAWLPPPLDFSELLCLRPLAGERGAMGERLRYRLCNSEAILRVLGDYLVRRKAYAQIPSLAFDTVGDTWAGDGNSTVTVKLQDSGQTPIPQGIITVRSMQRPTWWARMVSDLRGRATFDLDDGGYMVLISDGGRHAWLPTEMLMVPGPATVRFVGQPPQQEPYGPVKCLLWTRARPAPEPLLPPSPLE